MSLWEARGLLLEAGWAGGTGSHHSAMLLWARTTDVSMSMG